STRRAWENAAMMGPGWFCRSSNKLNLISNARRTMQATNGVRFGGYFSFAQIIQTPGAVIGEDAPTIFRAFQCALSGNWDHLPHCAIRPGLLAYHKARRRAHDPSKHIYSAGS